MRFWLSLVCCCLLAGCRPSSELKKPGQKKRSLPKWINVTPRRAALSPDGKLLLLACSARNLPEFREFLTLWNTETGKMLCTLHTGAKRANSIGFAPDGKLAVASCGGHTVRFYAMTGSKVGRPLRIVQGGSGPVAISPDERAALVLCHS